MSLRIRASVIAFVVIAAGCGGKGKGFSDPVDHLVVEPDGATIDTTTSITVKAVGVTVSGRHVDVSNVTWTATAGAVDASGNFSASSAADATLTATAQGKTGTGTIHVIAAGALDVLVVDAATGSPIAGANVAVLGSGGTAVVTAADGTGHLAGAFSGKLAVNAESNGYVRTTLFDVKAKKIKVPLRPASPPTPGQFQGTIDFTTAFQADQPPAGALWVGIAGPSIKGNVLAFGLDSLLGPSRPISISGFNVSAPSNVFVYGVTSDYIAVAPEGQTAAWALGGVVTLQQITDIISGGTSDLGAVVTQLLPTFNSFYYTLKEGLTVTGGATLPGQDLILDTKLGHVAALNVPARPVNDPNPLVVGAIDLGAAEGFAPAGLTVVQGANTLNASVHVPALSGAFAGKSYLFLTVSQEGGLGTSGANSAQQIAVLSRGITGQPAVDMPEFLVPPASGSFAAASSTRTASYPATAGADFLLQTFSHTVTMGTGSNAVSTIYQWDVATAGDSTGFVLPMVAGTNGTEAGSNWTVESLGLESQTYEGILTQGSPVDLGSYFNDANRVVITRANVQ